jgi:CelD/BcsL family acetyltransferase involved in cellulose biosynthesis
LNEITTLSPRLLHWREWPGMAAAWDSLLESTAYGSFFLSRAWVEAWLATFGNALNPELLVFESGGETVGACLLVWRTQWIKHLPVRRVYLNCSGEDQSVYIEYNALLAQPAWEERVAAALAGFLRRRRWDELVLPGMADQPVLRKLAALGQEEADAQVTRYVDLGRLRNESATYDSALSSNTRQQVRRSQRLYEETYGPCSVRAAQTGDEALAMCAELGELHNAAWQDRGKPGAFSSARFRLFHETLIRQAFPSGAAQLLRIEAGAEVIGVLYNFVYRGRVYFYQSGFRYTQDNRLKPGLVAHSLAIRYYLEQSTAEEYDFLAGDSQYKRSLATDSRTLCWSSVRRATVPTLLFYGLRSLKHTYVRLLRKDSRRTGPAVRAA